MTLIRRKSLTFSFRKKNKEKDKQEKEEKDKKGESKCFKKICGGFRSVIIWVIHISIWIQASWYMIHSLIHFNSLAPGKFEWHFRYLIFQIIWVIDGWGISWEIALRWMSLDLTDDKSTLVLVMAWCRQATSHYLSQCWPRYLSPLMASLGPNELNTIMAKCVWIHIILYHSTHLYQIQHEIVPNMGYLVCVCILATLVYLLTW